MKERRKKGRTTERRKEIRCKKCKVRLEEILLFQHACTPWVSSTLSVRKQGRPVSSMRDTSDTICSWYGRTARKARTQRSRNHLFRNTKNENIDQS